MKWAIIIMIFLSLVGSVMWVMPTPRQKYQAKLRQDAKALGFQPQLVRLTAPRASGEMDADVYNVMGYRLLCQQEGAAKRYTTPWHVFRVKAQANIGLPPNWCWQQGEGQLKEQQLQDLYKVLNALPEGVTSVESTPIHLTAFWDEEGGMEQLAEIKEQLKLLIERGL